MRGLAVQSRAMLLIGSLAVLCFSQAPSPQAEATIQLGGKSLKVSYCAPSVRGRKIFGDGGRISEDPNYPVWRAGANSATAFHTDADIDLGGLHVPKGDYTLYVLLADPNQWQLIVSKQTGQWGLEYDKAKDLGRVKMTMRHPTARVEVLKYSFVKQGANGAELQLAWDNELASVPIRVS